MLRGSPATASSVDVHLALVGKFIPSYKVVDRRVQGTITAVLRQGVATLRGRSRLLSSFQRRPWAPKRDFRPRSQSPV